MKKLSQAQRSVLLTLADRHKRGKEWVTAASIYAQAKTLQVLERLGHVEGRPKEGRRFAADKDYYEWRLKPKS